MLDEHAVFVDLETTGATATYDRITEVGVIEVNRGRLVSEWSTLVNPQMSIPPAIQALTGITNKMVAGAPAFSEIRRDLLQRLEGKLFIAHNARFDYGFLKNEFQRCGISFNARVLCTVKLSRRLYPQHGRHNLDALLERHELACEARHRALGDARVLWLLAQKWTAERGTTLVQAAVDLLLKTPGLPAGLPDLAVDSIPETPGVYFFYGDNDVLLYIGRNNNMRSRVMAHFSGDHRTNKDMRIAQQIRRIDWKHTAGELGALLLESRLVKQLAPVHNRQRRLKAAPSSLRTLPWPFAGRIAIRENAGDGETTELHVLDRWCYVGAVRSEAELHELSETRAAPVFDVDTYKILKRYIAKPPRGASIVCLSA